MVRKADLEKARSFLEDLKKTGITIQALYLYGSRAKGTNRAGSDLDIAVISKDFSGDSIRDIKMIFPVIKKADEAIEVTRFRPEDFRDEHPLAWEIKHEGVRIF
ncbi:nucleotidyltransferase domain-containing protein [bacterium]|nr:nucleotidyltransferase domain-containing protein [bacterium]